MQKWSDAHSSRATDFSTLLKNKGYRFFSGVPCSLLGAFIETLSQDPEIMYVPAVREDAAVGLAAGAYLSGKKAAVLMQNSGLGYSLNALTSLNLIYEIPALLLITYRGCGPDAPEHWVMGKSCEALLKEVGIPHLVPEKENLAAAFEEASEYLDRYKKPFAILIKRGIFGD